MMSTDSYHTNARRAHTYDKLFVHETPGHVLAEVLSPSSAPSTHVSIHIHIHIHAYNIHILLLYTYTYIL